MRRVIHQCALLAVVVGLLLALPAEASAQDDELSTVVLGLEVADASTVELRVIETQAPLGALDVTIDGFDVASTEPCQILGSGVCSVIDGGVSFVAFNTTGWSAGDTIVAITTAERAANSDLNVTLHLVGDVSALPMRVVVVDAEGVERVLAASERLSDPTVAPSASVTAPTPVAAPVDGGPEATEPPAPSAGRDDDGSGSVLPWIATAVAVVALAAFVLLRRSGKAGRAATPPSEHDSPDLTD